jgi:hypothetical protein
MKNLLSLIFIVFSVNALWAQGGSTLTKEETIKYLDTKIKETGDLTGLFSFENMKENWEIVGYSSIGPKIQADDGKIHIYYNLKTADKKELEITFVKGFGEVRLYDCGYIWYSSDLYFNPANIIDIKAHPENQSNSSVGVLVISLNTQNGKKEIDKSEPNYKIHDSSHRKFGYCFSYNQRDIITVNSVSEIYIPYLKADDTNFNKIKKALEHLKTLYKAESDPFGD